MADYYPLIARAITGLDKNTGETRRALYERARTALVAQLRGTDPPLPEAEITKERLALEEAIRKVEAEAARRSRVEGAPGAGIPGAGIPGAKTIPGASGAGAPSRFGNGLGSGRAPTPPSAQPPAPPPSSDLSAKAPPRSPVTPPPPAPPTGPAGRPQDPYGDASRGFDDSLEPQLVQEDFNRDLHPEGMHSDGRPVPGYPGNGAQDGGFRGPFPQRPPLGDMEAELEEERRRSRSFGPLLKALVALALIAAFVGVVYSQRGVIGEVWQALRGSSSSQVATTPTDTSQPATAPKQGSGKITDRLGGPSTQNGPAVAQRVVLYEEEPNDPQGKQFIGSAVWRTETVSPGPGRPPELAVRADVEIPDRRMTMTFSLRRNTDQTLPASHTIEVMFNLPADFPPGGISNVPGVLMKQAEQTRGTPLAGLAVKVTNNFFLIGLSAVESDQARNIQLLKERAWFDIPIVYNNNRRAILAIEKGTPGERAFAEAFAAWKQ